jgi:sialate O-acetylesterase
MDQNKLRLLAIGLAILTVSSLMVVYMFAQNRNHSEDKIRVACVGDSITEGTYYSAELWMLLGSKYAVGNFGVSGSTVSLSSGKPYMNETAFQEAEEFQPNIIVIMLGTNDADPYITPNTGSFVQDYIKLVDAFEALSTKPKDLPCVAASSFQQYNWSKPRIFHGYRNSQYKNCRGADWFADD